MNIAIVYILVSVVGGAVGQILLKKGMNNMGELTITGNQVLTILWKMATNPYVVIGLAIYVTGTFFWLVGLSRVDLSFAYPFASLSYVLMFLASWLILGEHITVSRVIGTIIICAGVFIVARGS